MELSFRQTQSLQLRQTLTLSQKMIQRFDILQQTLPEFNENLNKKSKENPFLNVRFMDQIGATPSSISGDDYVTPIDFATYDESLVSLLMKQLELQSLSDRDLDVVTMLIDACDDRGFIDHYKQVRADIMTQHAISERDVFRCLKILQSFEPEGVGARSVNECLWIQIDQYDLDDENDRDQLKYIVKHHLDDIANQSFDAMADALDCSLDQVMIYVDFIANLNPNPGSAYSTGNNVPIQPSIRVDIVDNELVITNLEAQRTSVGLNPEMIEKLSSNSSKELQQQFSDAKNLARTFSKTTKFDYAMWSVVN